jgi:peptide/nickel transport system permease protein
MASRSLSRVALFWRILRANPLSMVGFLMVAVICIAAGIVAVYPSLIVPYGPLELTSALGQPPSIAHPFGTDRIGLDLYSEVMRALPLDLGIGVAITGFAVLVGGLLGLVAGYWDRPATLGGYMSIVILRVTDVFLSFPSLILALAITVSLGVGVWQAILAVMLTWWPYYVRLVRGEVLAVKHLPYIQAAKAAGVSDGRILLRHVLRNVLEPVIVYLTMDIGTVLVVFSTIGFVASAVPYPSLTPEWGSMLSYYQGLGELKIYPWEVLAPGGAIFVTVLAFSLLGDGLRDILDPRTRRALASDIGRGSARLDAGSVSETPAPSAPLGATATPAVAETTGGGAS